MPKKGYKAITLKEEDIDEIERLAEKLASEWGIPKVERTDAIRHAVKRALGEEQ